MKKSSRRSYSAPSVSRKSNIQQNEGTADRIARVVIGIVIVGIGVRYQSWWGIIGLLPLFTGIAGHCCLYTHFGINTNK